MLTMRTKRLRPSEKGTGIYCIVASTHSRTGHCREVGRAMDHGRSQISTLSSETLEGAPLFDFRVGGGAEQVGRSSSRGESAEETRTV
jgi:hypothetical protein